MHPLRAALALSTLFTLSPRPPAFAASNTDETKVGALPLPDVLRTADGTPIRDVAAWRAHRPALLETFAREVYGRTPTPSPTARPPGLRWETTSTDRTALGGKATRKEITVHFTARADGPKLHLLIYQPNAGPTPYPAFLGLNYYGNQCVNADPGITVSTAWMRANPEFGIVQNRATAKTRGAHAHRWEIEKIIARGYATVTAYYGDLCPDHAGGLAESVGALFATGSTENAPPTRGAPSASGPGASAAPSTSSPPTARSTPAASPSTATPASAKPPSGPAPRTNASPSSFPTTPAPAAPPSANATSARPSPCSTKTSRSGSR